MKSTIAMLTALGACVVLGAEADSQESAATQDGRLEVRLAQDRQAEALQRYWVKGLNTNVYVQRSAVLEPEGITHVRVRKGPTKTYLETWLTPAGAARLGELTREHRGRKLFTVVLLEGRIVGVSELSGQIGGSHVKRLVIGIDDELLQAGSLERVASRFAEGAIRR